MLDIVLNLLSILGIVFLFLLGVLLLSLLLVLFFPVTYCVNARKDAEELSVSVKADWLFGLFRIRFAYPEPGRLIVKALCFKVFDSGREDQEDNDRSQRSGEKQKTADTAPAEGVKADNAKSENSSADESLNDKKSVEQTKPAGDEPVRDEDEPLTEMESAPPKSLRDKISAKYDKLKYTIRRIYDRIRHVWENISFYRELLTEDNTRELFRHACFRVGRILKSIRPRRVKADVLFGVSDPSTTGYLYGVYCMLSPKFGKDIHVTPDFEQAIFEGRLYAAGHVTVIQILFHGVSLLLDKRLRIFLRRLKKHGQSKSKQQQNGG